MSSRSIRTDYAISQKVVHWLMALLIMLDLVVAQKFGGEMQAFDRIESRSDHASVGLIVAVLFVIRILLRLRFGAPPLPAAMPRWQRQSSHIAHWALYVLIGLLIISGILSAIYANSVISPFGLFAYGNGTGDESAYSIVRLVHNFSTKAIIALISIHIVAAIYHAIVPKDGVLSRMLKFWRSEKPT